MADNISLTPEWGPAVARIWADGKPVGTAFVVGPRLALTCHHCTSAAGSGLMELRGTDRDGVEWCRTVVDTCSATSPMEADASILRFAEDATTVLPISANRTSSFGTLVAYGFPGGDPKQDRVRIDVESRDLKSFTYGNYKLAEGLALGGDPAAPGMSGSPVVDATAGVVVGMIVGGPDFDDRAMALPLWTLDTTKNPFPAFAVAAKANRSSLMHSGWAMNLLRAKDLCRRQVEDLLLRLKKQQRYDAERIVPREHLTRALASFLVSSRSTLVVASGPNSGKTSAMAAAAAALSGRSLFLEALQVSDVRIGFMRSLQDLLNGAPKADEGETIDLISRTLAAEKEPLIVFVDGINEISDDLSKVERWVAEAISEAQACNIKLILSCRTDFWRALDVSSAAPEVHDLGYFTPAEAAVAAGLYKVGTNLPSELGRHPLMFRILSRLGASSDSTRTGRFSAIEAFVLLLIKLTPGVQNPDAHLRACGRMVARIGPEEETIPWTVAANELGGSQFVDNLIQGGVFRTSDRETVRFAFDEMTEVLRPPLPRDLASLTMLWVQAIADGRMATSVLAGLARAAAEDNDDLVSTHAQAFVLAFAEFRKSDAADVDLLYGRSFGAIGTIFATLTSDMPSRFAAVSERMVQHFLDAVLELAKSDVHLFSERHLVPAIMELDISLNLRFKFLIELLALCSDFGLRDKDIFDRGGKTRLMSSAAHPQTSVAGALLALAIDHPGEFARLALPRLGDGRRLQDGGEATVGDVVMSLLRLNALACFNDLFSLLLEQTNFDECRRLLYFISSAHPTQAIECAAASLSTSRAVAVMDLVIGPSLRSLGAGFGPIALLERLRMVMRDGTPETRKMAALLIRVAEPDDLTAWDELAAMVRVRSADTDLYPVPAARATEFLDVINERSDEFAIKQMRWCIGDSRVEAGILGLAMKMFEAKPGLHKELADLAEQRLYKARESAFYSPWIAFGLRVAAAPSLETRRRLIYFASPDSDGSELRLQIWTEMLRGPVGLSLAADAFVRVNETDENGASNDLLMTFLRPMAHGHGPELLDVLKDEIERERRLFQIVDSQEKHDRLDCLLALLVQAVGERYPEVAEQLRERRSSVSDWIEVWGDPPVAS
ncbi:trypsin-like peptidase domain-containing protein [Rhizobium sp. RAF56]|uniref:serine protease n=1 Tax=Rhizobium sp. RAF56 TaxID=3233062 RepID=UPI003F9A4236